MSHRIFSDHIGRPVFATNASGVKTWTAAYLPFGGVRVTTGTPPTASGLRPFGTENSPLDCFPGAPHFRGNGSRARPACTRTGCGIMIRARGATCRPIRWDSSMGRVCMGRCRPAGRLLPACHSPVEVKHETVLACPQVFRRVS